LHGVQEAVGSSPATPTIFIAKMKPKSGDFIYMDSELSLSHGEDDIIGGRAEIKEVRKEPGFTWIVFTLFPDSLYNWAQLEPLQEKLKERFGDSRAHHEPDARPEFNDSSF